MGWEDIVDQLAAFGGQADVTQALIAFWPISMNQAIAFGGLDGLEDLGGVGLGGSESLAEVLQAELA